MRRALLLVPFCSLSLACADDDVGDAPDGWRAANSALQLGQSSFQSDVEIGVDGSIDVECPDGGSIAVEGHYDSDDEFSLAVTYSDCQAEDVRIDGTLSVTGTAVVTDTSVEVSVEYRGSLQWSGAANGSCDIDMDAYVGVQSEGNGASAEVRFDGEICGHDAKAVIEASADLG
jgi:hypothetical protein